MPARLKRDKRRRSSHITPEAMALFRRGFNMLHGPHDPLELRDLKVNLATALGRSKFAANPLDRQPRSLIGQGASVEYDLRRALLAAIGEADKPPPDDILGPV
jgi:hypothetical protein